MSHDPDADILRQVASDGKKLKLSTQQWGDLRKALVQYVTVEDGPHRYRFRCETPVEFCRAQSWSTKEQGTVAWIAREVAEGEVFYDVGANVGVYTLPAGKRVGETGQVYAFEPHVGNAQSLLYNIRDNELSDRVKVISAALSDREGFFDFHYFNAEAGTSMSQLGATKDAIENPFQPAFSELKFATTIDALIDRGTIRPANHIKIDVDGNELFVLAGMQKLLASSQPPRSLQVEINARHKGELFEFLRSLGYAMYERHDTALGKQALAAGKQPDEIAYNAIFRKAA